MKALYFALIPALCFAAICVFAWARRTGSVSDKRLSRPLVPVETVGSLFDKLAQLRARQIANYARLEQARKDVLGRLKALERIQSDHHEVQALKQMVEDIDAEQSAVGADLERFLGDLKLLEMQKTTAASEADYMRAIHALLKKWQPIVAAQEEPALSEEMKRDRHALANHVRLFCTWLHRGDDLVMRLRADVQELQATNPQHASLPQLRARLERRVALVDSLRDDLTALSQAGDLLRLRYSLQWKLSSCHATTRELLVVCEGMVSRHEEHFSVN